MLHKEKRLQIFQIVLPIILSISSIPFTPAVNVGAEHVVPLHKLDPVLKPLVLSSVLSSRAPTTSVPVGVINAIVKVSGNPSQYDDLNVFIEEQEAFRERVATSLLPLLEVDMSEISIDEAANKVADWLESTGGLYAKG